MGSEILNLSVLEQRFRNLFQEAPFSAALLSGGDFIVEMANEVTLQLWGKDSSIIGKPLLQGMPEMKDQPVYQTLLEVYNTGRTYQGKEQTAYLNLNGTLKKVYVNFVFKAVRDDETNITGILAVGYDVTDQVEAKQKLEESEARVRLSVEAVGIGTFEREFETNQTRTSPLFDRIFGLNAPHSHEDYIARIHPDDIRIWDNAHQKAVETGRLSYEARVLHDDNSFRWVKIDGLVTFNQDGQPSKLIGIARDINDEKLSHLKLVESEENFRTLISETPEVGAGLYTGRELRIQYVNDVMLRFWGKDRSVIGKTFNEALPELRDQPFLGQLDKVFTSGELFEGKEQLALLEVTGKLRPGYFNYTYKPLRNPQGEIYAVHHMAVDVTPQVESKLALIESEKKVWRLFEQTPVGIAVFNSEKLFIEMANETILRYWGRSSEQVLGKPLWSALPEVGAQGIDKITKQVYDTGVPYSSPETALRVLRNGQMESIVVRFAFIPNRDSHGNIIGLIGIANDVTDLVNARKKVEKNETRLQNLANAMPQVVWIAEEDGTVTYYNDRVKEFGGVIKVGDSWLWQGTVHPDDIEATNKAYSEAIRTRAAYEKEHRIQMKDGEYRWHLSRGFPFSTDDGIKWYGTATDVHDQKVLEMNLEKMVKDRTLQLERSNDDLQQFAHVASHDLKEPVRKIKTFSYKLQDEYKGALGDRGNSFLNRILHATDRMYSMINGVLEYASMPDANNLLENVDLNKLIDNITSDLEVLIQEKNAMIRFEHLPTIKGIPNMLYQLFYNLINNSLKFAKPNVPSSVTLTSSQIVKDRKRYYEIIVSDDGIGFDPAYEDQIFQTFFRLNSKDQYEGSGLGLALCKKIVERHEGFIFAKGEKGKGAQFIIQLPE